MQAADAMLEYSLWYAYFLGIAAVIMGAAECEAPKAGDKPGGRLILSAAVLLGALAFANVYQDYCVMQALQRGAIGEPTSALGPGDGSIPVLLDLQRSSLFAPFIECKLPERPRGSSEGRAGTGKIRRKRDEGVAAPRTATR